MSYFGGCGAEGQLIATVEDAKGGGWDGLTRRHEATKGLGEADSETELALPMTFSDEPGEKFCHRGHREHRGTSSVPCGLPPAEMRAVSSMAKERISL